MPISARGTSRFPNPKATVRAGYGARPDTLNCRIPWVSVQNYY
jgi:hypothetical protein